ncbi:Borealin N terminal-domain-containing protein [Phyllosticta paracitricarpa]
MPPQRAKKQTASQPSASNLIAEFPAPPTSSVASSPSAKTPERMSPAKKSLKVSVAQKQALMDNLQLEVTERARKLRAQYALLSQGLRSRLEMRVNRIPSSLRRTNIMDLVEKYSEQSNSAASTQSQTLPSAARQTQALSKSSTPEVTRGKKRPSNEISVDKEKAVHRDTDSDLALPKKRTKTTPATNTSKTPATGPTKSRARVVSNQDAPTTVLSPKSNNSRSYPRSPIKAVDEKPLKPPPGSVGAAASPLKASLIRPDTRAGERPGSRGKAGTTGTGRGKKAATKTAASSTRTTRARVSDASSSDSVATDATTGTTIVRKPTASGTGAKKASARTATTKSTTARAAAAAKKGKENAPGAGATGRVLRTRR